MYRWAKYLKDRLEGKAEKGEKRSSQWRKTKKAYYAKYGKRCAFCGSKKKIELHHIIPFNVDPSLELEESNLLPLCDGGGDNGMKSCHFFAHLGDWKRFNPNIREDCLIWSSRFGWKDAEENK